MRTVSSVPSVQGIVLTALAIASTSTMCLDYKEKQSEFEPLLCTVEQHGQFSDSFDIIQLAKDMAAARVYEVANFSINRTVISSDDVFDFVENGCNLLNPYCAAVITIASCPVVLAIDDWTEEMSIPHVIYCTELDPCHVTSSHSIHLAPVGPIKSDVVDVLLQRMLKWKELVFIYDHYLDLVQLSKLRSVLSKSLVSYGVFKIERGLTNQTIEDAINATREMHHVLLAVSSNVLEEILEKANITGLFTKDYQWIVMSNSSCLSALGKTVLRGSSVLYLRQSPFIKDLDGPGCVHSWTDLSYNEEPADLLSAGMEAFIRGSVKGDLYSEIYSSNSICDKKLITFRKKAIMEAKMLTIRTSEGHVKFNSSSGKVDTYGFQFCSTDDTSPDGYSTVGSWDPVTNLNVQQSLFMNAFKDFRGRRLFVGSLEAPPFVVKTLSGNKTIYDGFCFDLLKELANRLNFTYEIVEPADKDWGMLASNGSWTGIVGMVMRGEVEFGIGPLTITAQREAVIDFTTPYLEDGVGILTKRVKVDSNAMFRLFTPLQPVVWTCLGASIVGVSLILYFFQRLSPTPPRRHHLEGMTLFACFWAILGSTLNQGSELQPKSNSGRLILGTWWVFTIIFVSTYTANMAAVLTITIYDKPINSLAELSSQTEIKPLVQAGTSVHSLFKEATNKIYKDVWNQMVNMPVIKSTEEALALVRSSNYAFLSDKTQLEYILLKECDNYALADEMFNTGGMGFIVQQDAAFLTSFDLIIMKLQESGILDAWRGKWWAARGNKCNGMERSSTVAQLDLNYLAAPFFIFMGTMVLSILVVLAERVYITNRCKRWRGRLLQSNTAPTTIYNAYE